MWRRRAWAIRPGRPEKKGSLCCARNSRLSFCAGICKPRIHRALLGKAWDFALYRTKAKVGRSFPLKTLSSERCADLLESAHLLAGVLSTERRTEPGSHDRRHNVANSSQTG